MKTNDFKVGDVVNVSVGKDIDEPFTGEVVGFIDRWVVVDCEGDHLEISPWQLTKA